MDVVDTAELFEQVSSRQVIALVRFGQVNSGVCIALVCSQITAVLIPELQQRSVPFAKLKFSAYSSCRRMRYVGADFRISVVAFVYEAIREILGALRSLHITVEYKVIRYTYTYIRSKLAVGR